MTQLYPYEILVIFDPRPTDEDIAALLTRLQENLKGLGAEVGKVLHVGTGMARLMVVTFDTCAGPRAYAGLASSYYELITEDFERLTDPEWSLRLAQDRPTAPEWASSILAESP